MLIENKVTSAKNKN